MRERMRNKEQEGERKIGKASERVSEGERESHRARECKKRL